MGDSSIHLPSIFCSWRKHISYKFNEFNTNREENNKKSQCNCRNTLEMRFLDRYFIISRHPAIRATPTIVPKIIPDIKPIVAPLSLSLLLLVTVERRRRNEKERKQERGIGRRREDARELNAGNGDLLEKLTTTYYEAHRNVYFFRGSFIEGLSFLNYFKTWRTFKKILN